MAKGRDHFGLVRTYKSAERVDFIKRGFRLNSLREKAVQTNSILVNQSNGDYAVLKVNQVDKPPGP